MASTPQGVSMLPPIAIHSTLGQSRQPFVPIRGNFVRVFVCGPTVYDYPHLGHAKTYTQFDFIVRTLRWLGYDVFYLQNITDIDDKIIARSAERGISWRALADEFEQIYMDDMRALHNTAVNKYARATDYVPQILAQVRSLLDTGHAYRTNDGVYFDIASFAEYGKLSGRTQLHVDDAVSRIDDSVAKRNWNDFCLWKAEKPGEPSWQSTLGAGRPGWHIEDTAITETELGPQYDLHGGAIDLIFPHHEAEIAQMEAITGHAPLAKYWLHTGFLNIDHEKMAKSTQNFVTIRQALTQHDYRILRFFFLSHHYRSSLNYSEDSLTHARNGLKRLDEFLFRVDREVNDDAITPRLTQLRDAIVHALREDFHTPQALAAIYGFITEAHTSSLPLGRGVFRLFSELNGLFDFMELKELTNVACVEDEGVAALIHQRDELRARRKFGEADAIRDNLLARGIQIYDTTEGVRWRRA
jgi:cysteinyl-tRNA synthetase